MTNDRKFPPLPFMSAADPEPPKLPPPLPRPEGIEFRNLPASRLLAFYRSADRERRTCRRLVMLPPSLDDKLRKEAFRRQDSINNTIINILEEFLQ